MDITNPDLTKKVLNALNPNDILDEDQFEKKLFLLGKKKPKIQIMEEQRAQQIERGKKSVDEAIQKKGLERKPFFNRFKSSPKVKPVNSRTNIQKELGVKQEEINSFKKKRMRKTKNIPFENVFPQKNNTSIPNRNNPLFTRKIKKPKKNISFDNVFPQKNNTSIPNRNNPLFTRKIKKPNTNVPFEQIFPQKNNGIKSYTNPLI